MPLFQNITLADGKATPVSHVFTPVRKAGAVAEWAEPSADGSLVSRNTLFVEQKLPGRGRSTASNELQIVIPVVATETINGVPRTIVIDKVRAIVQIVAGPATPKSYRTDARVLLSNALKNADVVAAFDDVTGF